MNIDRLRKVIVRGLCAGFAFFTSGQALSQTIIEPPVISVVDSNGVNLATGQFQMPGLNVSIGVSSSGLVRASGERGSDNFSGKAELEWISDHYGTNYGSGTYYFNVSYAGRVHRFLVGTSDSNSTITVNSGPYTEINGPAKLSCSGTGTSVFAGNCTLTLSDGTVVIYASAFMQTITLPTGEVISLTYYNGTNAFKNSINTVSSTLGWTLKYDVDSSYNVIKITGVNTAVAQCTSSSCSVSSSFPYATLTTNGSTNTIAQNGVNLLSYSLSSGMVTLTWPSGVTKTVLTSGTGSTITTLGKVTSLSTGGSTWTYSYSTDSSGNTTTKVTEPTGATKSLIVNYKHQITSQTDEAGRTTSYTYYSTGQIASVIYPGGNASTGGYQVYTYDSRNNVLTKSVIPRGGGTAITTTAVYPTSCNNIKTCNKPISITDPSGVSNNYTYDNSGNLLSETKSAVNGVAPQTRYAYASYTPYIMDSSGALVAQSSVTRLASTSTCMTGSSCSGTSDELKTAFTYGTSNLQPTQVTVTHGNPVAGTISSLTTTTTYDSNGNVIVTDGPLPGVVDEVYTFYDSLGRKIGTLGIDPDDTGSLKRPATRIVYNSDGKVSNSESGVAGSGASSSYSGSTAAARWAQAYTDWSSMTVQMNDTTDYSSSNGLPIVSRHYDSGTLHYVTQTSYDSLFRVDCVAQRLNTSIFASVTSTAACTPATAGSDGPDRIVHYTYDSVGNVLTQVSAYGTSSAATDFVKTYNSTTGLLATAADGLGNLTTYSYDSFDRLIKTCYPQASSGSSSSTSDCDQMSYSLASVYQRILRDGQTTTYTYDALGRVSSTTGAIAASFIYNNFGKPVTVSRNGVSETYTYDTLGMVLSDVQPMGTVGYQYDAYGRRTQLQYPGGLNIDYTYDNTGKLKTISEDGGSTLASYTYDNYGRSTNVAFGNGYASALTYDDSQRLQTLTNTMSGGSNVITLGYSSANQTTTRTQSNGAYEMTLSNFGTTASTYNGLNQAATVGGTSFSYDARGNLTSDGSVTYGYNASNLLTSTSAGAVLSYDALDRLRSISSSSTATRQFLYDGTTLIAEYDSSGALVRRYVHGSGTDNPIVWYEGSGTGTKYYFQTDERGSITGVTNASGVVQAIYAYDAYGVPKTNSGSLTSRFGYTGQVWLPEVGMYNYKARIYAPTLGRFMQADPIGYGDGMNMYAYVHGDPINGSDPSGNCETKDEEDDDGNCHYDYTGNGWQNSFSSGGFLGNGSGSSGGKPPEINTGGITGGSYMDGGARLIDISFKIPKFVLPWDIGREAHSLIEIAAVTSSSDYFSESWYSPDRKSWFGGRIDIGDSSEKHIWEVGPAGREMDKWQQAQGYSYTSWFSGRDNFYTLSKIPPSFMSTGALTIPGEYGTYTFTCCAMPGVISYTVKLYDNVQTVPLPWAPPVPAPGGVPSAGGVPILEPPPIPVI